MRPRRVGRRAVLVLVVAALVAAGLLAVGAQRPRAMVDEFARVATGCVSTVEFTETGRFVVYREDGGERSGGCAPSGRPGASLEVTVDGPRGIVPLRATSAPGYERGDGRGEPMGEIRIGVIGTYEVTVTGDPVRQIAIGRQPSSGPWAPIAGAVAGLGIIGALLTGRRRGVPNVVSAPVPTAGWAPPRPDDRIG